METFCLVCVLGESQQLPFPPHAVGEIVHSDILGPLQMSYPGAFQVRGCIPRWQLAILYDPLYHSSPQPRWIIWTLLIEICLNTSPRSFFFWLICISSVMELWWQLSFMTLEKQLSISSSPVYAKYTLMKEYKASENNFRVAHTIYIMNGVQNSFLLPYTSELNGISAHLNRTMLKSGLVLLI